MKIHEYQAKAILKKYGVTVPRGSMAASREEAEAIAKDFSTRARAEWWSRRRFTPEGAAKAAA